MIINYPTGLYSNVLPQKPSDGGNVTYTISNSVPPRTNLLFPKVPRGIVDRQRAPDSIDPSVRREFQGELVFSVSSADQSVAGSSSRTYEIGQILEFGEEELISAEPMFVGPKSESRHNTNVFDYQDLGLSQEDIDVLNESAARTKAEIADKLNAAKEARKNAEAEASRYQKIINDANRNINAMQIIADNSDETDPQVSQLLDKFITKRDEAAEKRDEAVSDANAAAAEASDLQDQLNSISVVVK